MSITADSSLSVLRYVEETTPGTTPASPLIQVRQTGNSLTRAHTFATSNEIQSDRNIRDSILTDMEPSGNFNFELSADDHDAFIEGAMFSDWSAAVAISAIDISAASADNSYNSTTTNFVTSGVVVGMWLKISGFATSANNGICKVVSVTTSKVVVSVLTLVNESAGPTAVMGGRYIKNGTTFKTYTLENEFTDITQFINFKGMAVNSMNLNFAVGEILNGSFDFIGMSSAIAGSTVGTGAPIASSSNDVMNAVTDISNIRENGALLSSGGVYVLSASLTLENGLRGQKALGTLGNVGVGVGRCNITGELQCYFLNQTLYNKFINNTATSLDLRVTDGTDTYIIELPNIKFTGGDPTVGGIDQDVVLALNFQALYNATLGCTLQIAKV